MDNPYGIAQVDIPGLLGMHQQLKRQRLADLYQEKEIAQKEREWARQEKMDRAYADVFASKPTPAAAQPSPLVAPESPQEPLTPANDQEAADILKGAHASSRISSTDAARIRMALGPDGQEKFQNWMKTNNVEIADGNQGMVPTEAPPTYPEPQQESAQIFRADPEKLRALMALGPDGIKAAEAISNLSNGQIKDAQEGLKRSMEIKGRVINGVRALPTSQREGEYQRQRALLVQSGMDPNALPQHWSESQADMLIQQSLTAAEALGMEKSARQFAETVRHNQVVEGQGAARISQAQARENRIKQWGPPKIVIGGGGINTSTDDLDY